MKKGLRENRINGNEGFTIVELIVCVAILAIAVIPLYHSMTSSTMANSKAQSLQNATSLGEDIMEEIKASTIDELGNRYNGTKTVDAGRKIPKDIPITIDETVFTGYLPNEMITKVEEAVSNKSMTIEEGNDKGRLVSGGTAESPYYVLYKKNAVSTQGESFDVIATISPREYQQGSSSFVESSTDNINVLNINSIKLPDLEEIDTLSQTVLTPADFGKYDKAAEDYFLQSLKDISTSMYDPNSVRISKKEIAINKSGQAAASAIGLINTKCTVKYTAVNGNTYTRDLFSGSYPAPRYSKVASGGSTETKYNEIKSNIYLFYKNTTGAHEEITITDTSTGGSGNNHKVFLVAQSDSANPEVAGTPLISNCDIIVKSDSTTEQVHFTCDDTGSISSTLDEDGNIKGTSNDKYVLVTNLKGSGSASFGHIYNQKSTQRVLGINVILTKDDGKVYASLNSSKSVKPTPTPTSTPTPP